VKVSIFIFRKYPLIRVIVSMEYTIDTIFRLRCKTKFKRKMLKSIPALRQKGGLGFAMGDRCWQRCCRGGPLEPGLPLSPCLVTSSPRIRKGEDDNENEHEDDRRVVQEDSDSG
jgi:hypothetical protein